MARNKKSKRPNLPQETLERARAELRGGAAPLTIDVEENGVEVSPVAKPKVKPAAPSAPPKAKRGGITTARRIPTVEELLGEYRYVTRDLRQLGILAGSLLIAIVVISLILSHV